MVDYELLEGQTGESRYVAVGPEPLSQEKARVIDGQLEAQGIDTIGIETKGDCTEFGFDATCMRDPCQAVADALRNEERGANVKILPGVVDLLGAASVFQQKKAKEKHKKQR